MSLFRLFRVLCCYLLYQGFKRLDRPALWIILKYALSVSACFGNSDRSWDFRFEHVEVSPVALTELRADVLGEVGAFIRHRHEHH